MRCLLWAWLWQELILRLNSKVLSYLCRWCCMVLWGVWGHEALLHNWFCMISKDPLDAAAAFTPESAAILAAQHCCAPLQGWQHPLCASSLQMLTCAEFLPTWDVLINVQWCSACVEQGNVFLPQQKANKRCKAVVNMWKRAVGPCNFFGNSKNLHIKFKNLSLGIGC